MHYFKSIFKIIAKSKYSEINLLIDSGISKSPITMTEKVPGAKNISVGLLKFEIRI